MGTIRKPNFQLIFFSGLLVGSLDIFAAFIDYYIATGKGPQGVLKYIASGVFGMKAFKDGSSMLIWGLFFHFVIAFGFTFLYFGLYQKVKLVSAQPVLFAIIYAIFMWAVTTQVVMPLSNVPNANPGKLLNWKVLKAIGILLVAISIPLTLIARKYQHGNKEKNP